MHICTDKTKYTSYVAILPIIIAAFMACGILAWVREIGLSISLVAWV